MYSWYASLSRGVNFASCSVPAQTGFLSTGAPDEKDKVNFDCCFSLSKSCQAFLVSDVIRCVSGHGGGCWHLSPDSENEKPGLKCRVPLR